MPTPNEIIRDGPLAAAEHTRPSRPQLACPEDGAPYPTTHWRAPDETEPEYPSSGTQSRANTEMQLSIAVLGEEKLPLTRNEPAHTQSGSPEKYSHFVPSPTTTEQKPVSPPSLSSGSSPSWESPYVPCLGLDISYKRLLPSITSSFLRSGSKFVGKQTSDRSTYEVHVELKHVDMSESFLCGYLRIKGLTEDHPTLTTYFEGEMIGDKYSFQTRRPEWGSSEKNDFQHWARFDAYRPFMAKARRPDFNRSNFAQRENIFMRWKEYFLVPDHRVRQISGASFEGFYYICFNQVSGEVEGIYFHAKSEKFQKLNLKHVPERNFTCMEFR